MRLHLVIDAHRHGHDMHTTDDGTTITLTCSCDEFTAICTGPDSDLREASVTAAFEQHIAKIHTTRTDTVFHTGGIVHGTTTLIGNTDCAFPSVYSILDRFVTGLTEQEPSE
jgi:hypothetical protein